MRFERSNPMRNMVCQWALRVVGLLLAIAVSTGIQAQAQAQNSRVNPKEDAKPTNPGSATLSIKEVVERGIENSPTLRIKEADWREAQSFLRKSESALLPTLNANILARSRQDPSVLRQSNVAAFSALEEYNAQLTLSQPIYRGGALLNGIGKFRTQEELKRQLYLAERQLVVEAVIGDYLTVAEKESLYTALREQTELLASHAKVTQRHEEIGRARKIDRLQASVNLAISQGETVRIDGERVIAANKLRRELGLDTSEAPWPGPFPFKISGVTPMKRSEVYAAAEANNPEVKAKVLARAVAVYDNALDWVEDRPALNLEGSFGYRSFLRPSWFDDASRYYAVGLNLTIPIFSGLSSLAKRGIHSQNLKRVDSDIANAKLTLRQEIDNHLQSVQLNANRLFEAENAARQAREALQLANSGYTQGVATHQDVLTSQNTRFNSEKLLIETQYAYLRSLLSLRRLMGVDLESVYAK